MISDDVVLEEGVKIFHPNLVNLYGCTIGANTKIGTFVEIQRGAVVGKNCKIQSHAFICDGVEIKDGAFIGHGVKFINDRRPRSVTASGELQTEADWKLEKTVVEEGASIGTNATIMCGITIGRGAMVGAGSVVTKDVAAGAIVMGVPARQKKK